MSPGMSPQLAASAFLKSQPLFALSELGEKTSTDALASDCAQAIGFVSCKSKFSASAPLPSANGWLRLDYAPDTSSPKSKNLARAWMLMAWSEPLAGGWEAFLDKRPKPSGTGELSRAKALTAFVAEEAPEFGAASLGAKKYKAAVWRFKNASGAECELSAVAALDAKGNLAMLSAETTLSAWGMALRSPARSVPNVP
jgi:hypothetical protein